LKSLQDEESAPAFLRVTRSFQAPAPLSAVCPTLAPSVRIKRCRDDRKMNVHHALANLPPEILLAIFAHLDRPHLPQLSLLCRSFAPPAQYTLFRSPSITSLTSLDALLSILEPTDRRHSLDLDEDDDWDHDTGWVTVVMELRLECLEFGQKGWGQRIARLLRVCRNVQRLELLMIDDLRPKQLMGNGGVSSSLYCDART
jgi:hypothetical protein